MAFLDCYQLKTINYAGTKKQWKLICTDGDLVDSYVNIDVLCQRGKAKIKGR